MALGVGLGAPEPEPYQERIMRKLVRALTLLGVLMLAGAALAADWGIFKSDKFGFAMLVPPNSQWAAKDYGSGWGGIFTKSGVTEFVGIVKLDSQGTPVELENAAIKLTGIPAAGWKKVDEGTNKAGWRWWRTYEATGNGKVLLTVLGTGPKGSYVLFLGTTAADMAAHRPQYQEWYNKLTLF
jgi:hypothetical protein